MSLGNTNRKKIHLMLGTTNANQRVTGSIYKICAHGGDAVIVSASFGWNAPDLQSPAPAYGFEGTDLTLNADAANHPSCIEADFTAVSASANTLIFYKGNLR